MHALLRFTLDLFDSAPARSKEPLTPVLEPKLPSASVDRHFNATNTVANEIPALPTQSLTEALAPATFRHPQATREALLDGTLVAYAFRRGKRRTIGFVVGADGLQVSAPKWVPLYEVDNAVKEKAAWILKKLQESRARGQRMEAARVAWADGAEFPFLGASVRLVLDPRHDFSGVGGLLAATPEGGHTLQVGLPHHASAQQIRDAVQAWLMRQAKRIFTERLNHFAPQLGVQWKTLKLSSAGTRWGSASADGTIRLNWRLLHYPMNVLDYVVAHELSHLRVMDHSPRFWSTVESVMPDYAALRGQLRDDAVPRW